MSESIRVLSSRKAGPNDNSEIPKNEVEDNVSEAETEIPDNEIVVKREPIHFQSTLLLTEESSYHETLGRAIYRHLCDVYITLPLFDRYYHRFLMALCWVKTADHDHVEDLQVELSRLSYRIDTSMIKWSHWFHAQHHLRDSYRSFSGSRRCVSLCSVKSSSVPWQLICMVFFPHPSPE